MFPVRIAFLPANTDLLEDCECTLPVRTILEILCECYCTQSWRQLLCSLLKEIHALNQKPCFSRSVRQCASYPTRRLDISLVRRESASDAATQSRATIESENNRLDPHLKPVEYLSKLKHAHVARMATMASLSITASDRSCLAGIIGDISGGEWQQQERLVCALCLCRKGQ